MRSAGPIDFIPLPGVFAITLLLVLVSIESGYRLGRFRRKQSEHEKEAPVGAMVGATLGLLAFLLAFTFGMAANRFDARRGVLLDESNAIGTAYLRAAMLPEHRVEVQALLREYVDVRLAAVQTLNIAEAAQRSEQLHSQLWALAVAVAEKHPNSIVVGLYIQALNEVIDIHSKRMLLAVRNRIPGTIWFTLCAVAMLSMAVMGYHAGLTVTSRSLAVLVVAFTFSVVIWLIADLDRPQEGTLIVSQQPMIDLRKSMNEPQP